MNFFTVGIAVAAAIFLIGDVQAMARRQTSDAPPAMGNDTTTDDMSGMGTTAGPVDMVSTDAPAAVTTDAAPAGVTTDAVAGMTDDMGSGTTDAPMTTTGVPCVTDVESDQKVLAFTKTPVFRDLTKNEQVFIYTLLAAGEGCRMSTFVTAETAERMFRLLQDLPLKYVFTFANYISQSLENEGVVVPV